MTFQTMHRQ